MWTEIFTVLAVIIILYFVFYLGIKLRKHYYKSNEDYLKNEQKNNNEIKKQVLNTVSDVTSIH